MKHWCEPGYIGRRQGALAVLVGEPYLCLDQGFPAILSPKIRYLHLNY